MASEAGTVWRQANAGNGQPLPPTGPNTRDRRQTVVLKPDLSRTLHPVRQPTCRMGTTRRRTRSSAVGLIVSTKNRRAELVTAHAHHGKQAARRPLMFPTSGNTASLPVQLTGLDDAVLPAWRAIAYSLGTSGVPGARGLSRSAGSFDAEVLAGEDSGAA